ncbi:MAG: hypothetical protein AAF648_16405 [Pseudomonadota bacterium]
MKVLVKLFFSPLLFAVLFLFPLFTELAQLSTDAVSGIPVWQPALAFAVGLGLLAQFRGSWIGVKG